MAAPPVAVFELTVRLTSPALLGGRLGAGGVAETWLVRGEDGATASPTAVLPGSSLRGVLRHASRRFGEARGIACTRRPDGQGVCDCPTCELFGGSGKRGRLRVRTAVATSPELLEVTRVAIDRQRRTASPDALWTSRLVLADFVVRLELDAPADSEGATSDPAAAHLRALLGWLEAVGIGVGRSKSTMGRATLTVREARPPAPPPVTRGGGPQRRWRLQLRTLEPLRLADLRDRPFFQHGKAFVPAPTLVGAIGWGWVRAGRPELAEAAFVDGKVWVSEAWPLGDGGYDWRASARWCEGCGAKADLAVAQTAAALVGSTAPERCPHCGAGEGRFRLRRVERNGAALFVSGHTAIDPTSGRVHEGLLYQQQLCEPGTTFAADLLAPEWAAAAIESLGELAVGGARSRGLGWARVALEPASPPASVEECLACTREALARHGADVPDGADVAILDVVTAAHVGEPLDALVAARGCRLVTGEGDIEVLGGWDERRDQTRPLREVLARGSWLALQGPAEALAGMEGIVVPDAEGWCPLWLRLREGDDTTRIASEEVGQ